MTWRELFSSPYAVVLMATTEPPIDDPTGAVAFAAAAAARMKLDLPLPRILLAGHSVGRCKMTRSLERKCLCQ
jgi:hypothetical protein